ncbi:solute carrier family 25 member 24, like isoform X1 [Phyllopteryx taeniolatus]|uniref:solute carrier family 25 member 24, like isoform X1 n=2 Tax=Phyllopteryx taeniolatus TaxID=161469 RepID=UPI002AD4CFC6|nr:solute carrier family 25 member 24, like isoform X1 [Phyllopteryx taeniolatus]XP_061654455.1 solute carrier family 25 member 24, like isoform X1 [Phyllopteryx taeniolatus]
MDQFRGLFVKLDRNQDGFISLSELRSEMSKHGISAAEAKVQNVIDSYDNDNNGQLDYDEFLSYMMDRERKWKICFDHLDKNKSGLIDQEDIICLFKELGVVISKAHANKVIQMMDTDGSMTVDWDEFLQHVILKPVDDIGELVSSWKHSLVFDVGESRALAIEFPEESSGIGAWRKFVLGAGLADAVSRTVTAPIDRLKTQLQFYGSKAFTRGLQELRFGNLRSMWQGNAVNVLKGTPQSTLQCLIYAQMKVSMQGRSQGSLSVQQRFGLGCVSGAVAHAVFYPLEVLKVRLNLQRVGTYHGMVACARSIYRDESLSSFYRGFKPSIICMIPYAGVECAVHQSIMTWAQSDPAYSTDCGLFFFSFVAFACGQMSSYPLAVIRTQQQAQEWGLRAVISPANWRLWSLQHPRRPRKAVYFGSHTTSSGVLEGLVRIYERHGLRGYYNGMGASFVRAVPCALINFTLCRMFQNLFSSMGT